jgi:hypothetical protein
MNEKTVQQFIDEKIEENKETHPVEQVKLVKQGVPDGSSNVHGYLIMSKDESVSGTLWIDGPNPGEGDTSEYLQGCEYEGPIYGSKGLNRAIVSSPGPFLTHKCSDGIVLEVEVAGYVIGTNEISENS